MVRGTLEQLDRGLLREVIEDALRTADRGVGSVIRCPPGTGKTQAAIEALVERGTGVIAIPDHRLGTEILERIQALGGAASHAEGLMRVFEHEHDADLVRRVRPLVEHGWEIEHIAEELDLDLPAAVHGEGEIAVITHGHLPVPLPIPRRGRGRRRRQTGQQIVGPAIFDEAPPWTIGTTIPLDQLVPLIACTDDRMANWPSRSGLRHLAEVILAAGRTAQADRRDRLRSRPRDPALRHPDHHRGSDLARLVVDAAGGLQRLRRLVTRAYGVHGPPWIRPLREPPPRPVRDAVDGRVTWVRRDIDWIVRALIEDVLRDRGHAVSETATGCTLRVSGAGSEIEATYVVHQRWSARLPLGAVPIILDAAAGIASEVYSTCYPGLRPVRVEVVDAPRPVAVHLPYAACSRGRLLAERADPRVLDDRAPAVLERVLATIIEQSALHVGPEASVVWFVPLAIERLLAAVVAIATSRASAEDRDLIHREGLDGLVKRLRAAINLGQIARLTVDHYGRERGRNAYSDYNVVVTLPSVPNLGDVGDQEHALGLPATGRDADGKLMIGPLVHAIAQSAYLQAGGRIRAIRAGAGSRKLHLHIDRTPPAMFLDAVGAPTVVLDEPGGGPVPRIARAAVAGAAGIVHRAVGAVGVAMLVWLRGRDDVARRLDPTGRLVDLLRALPGERTLQDQLATLVGRSGWAGSWFTVIVPASTITIWSVFGASQEAADRAVTSLVAP